MSAQGLTYPHDLFLSRNALPVLQRVMVKTVDDAKLLILLRRLGCFQSGQRVRNQDRTSVWGRRPAVAHKVFHRPSGENQKRPLIKNLAGEPEHRLNCEPNARGAPCGEA